MRIKALEKKVVEVEISEQEQLEIVFKYIRERFKLPRGSFLKKGVITTSYEVGGGSHSWFEENKHGKPTEDQVKALELLNILRPWPYHETL